MFILAYSLSTVVITGLAALIAGVGIGYAFLKNRGASSNVHSGQPQTFNVISSSLSNHLIPNDQAVDMINAYPDSAKAPPSSDRTKSIFIPLNILNDYVNQMISKSANRNLGITVSGIRIFLARYTQKSQLPDALHKVGQVTSVIYPTYTDGKQQVSFDPALSLPGRMAKIEDLLSDSQRVRPSSGSNLKSTGGGDSALNRSQSSPPWQP